MACITRRRSISLTSRPVERRWYRRTCREFRASGLQPAERRSIADDRYVEAALRELALHPSELILVVVGSETNAITDALVRQRAFLNRRFPAGKRESRAEVLGVRRRRERACLQPVPIGRLSIRDFPIGRPGFDRFRRLRVGACCLVALRGRRVRRHLLRTRGRLVRRPVLRLVDDGAITRTP